VTTGPINIISSGAQSFEWKLIASDGAGMVSMIIDSAGNPSNFPTSNGGTTSANTLNQVAVSGTTPTNVGTTYTFTYNMPALTCTGSLGGRTDICIAQISSVSDWVACFAFAYNAVSTTGGTPAYTCVTASGLTACPMINGKQVNLPDGETLASLDASVQATINQNFNESRVFLTGNAPAAPGQPQTPCEQSYRAYLCGATFGACARNGGSPPPISPCAAVCSQFECWCSLNPIHAYLYSCATLDNAGSDEAGDCSKGYGPNNATCTAASSTASAQQNCQNGILADCSAASMTQPVVLAVAVLAALAARFAARL